MRHATQLVAIGLAVAICGSMLQAAVLVNETFTYPDGNLVGQGGWTAHSSAGSKPVQVVSGQARVVQSTGSAEDINVPLGDTLGAGEKFYAGFDLTQSGGSGQVVFAHFLQGASNFAARLYVTNNGQGDYTLAIGDTSIVSTLTSGLNFGTTYRIVTSYDFDSKQVEMWVNPADGSATPDLTFTSGFQTPVTAYALRQASPSGSAQQQLIDNLVVATTLGEVVPDPATLALLGLGSLLVRARRRP